MRKFYGYLNSAIYNIRHNKAYAIFCVLGTALTFVFISIILQLVSGIYRIEPPFINADRVVRVEQYLEDKNGEYVMGLSDENVPLFLDNIKEYELCAWRNMQDVNMLINGKYMDRYVSFVSSDYWKINRFDFIAGRPFTEQEVTSKIPVLVLTKTFVESNFKTDEIVGQKIELNNIIFTVVGVIDDYPTWFEYGQVWAPSTLNKFRGSNAAQTLFILPMEGVDVDDFKDEVASALKYHYKNRSIDIDLESDDLATQREKFIGSFGSDRVSYGIPIILLILLLIPAINIVVINIAIINNRAKEIAIRRSMGATIFSSFMQIMVDNLLLVVVGTIIGALLATPIATLISILFLSDATAGREYLITNIDFSTLICGILPLSLLFTLISGGIPAYLIAKSNISNVLKGDFNQSSSIVKRFLGIFIEQALVFIILMLSIVSISIAVHKYNEPGMLNTADVITFGYTETNRKDSTLVEVRRKMAILVDDLKEDSNVIALTKSHKLLPYLNNAEYSNLDSVVFDNIKLKVVAKGADKYGMRVFAPDMVEGDWISDSKLSDGSWSAVITEDISETLKWDRSVGRKFSFKNQNFTIVGVVSGLKNYVFSPSIPSIVIPLDIGGVNMYGTKVVKVHDKDLFVSDYFREFNKLMKNKNVSPYTMDSDELKVTMMSGVVTDIAFQTIPTLFLLIFAFIGTYGIFWLTSQKRVKEFALRIAVGSTPRRLMWLVIKESVVVTALSMIPGLILAHFICEFTIVNVAAIGITVIIMSIFAVFSAWHPAYVVSKIHPSKTLKYE